MRWQVKWTRLAPTDSHISTARRRFCWNPMVLQYSRITAANQVQARPCRRLFPLEIWRQQRELWKHTTSSSARRSRIRLPWPYSIWRRTLQPRNKAFLSKCCMSSLAWPRTRVWKWSTEKKEAKKIRNMEIWRREILINSYARMSRSVKFLGYSRR